MRSIRTQLILWLVGGILLLTILAGAGLYGYMEEVLERSLDAALAVKAEAIAGAVHMEDDGRPHLQSDELMSSASFHHEGAFYFQIWQANGKIIEQLMPPGNEAASLPRHAQTRKRFTDAKLPDGTWARMTQLSFVARADEDEFDAPTTRPNTTPERLALVVAHDRRSVDGPLAMLLSGLLLAAALIISGVLVIVPWRVGRGLKPLESLSQLADTIRPDSLNVRFPARDQLPPELSTIGSKLNELMDRLQSGFARERRISAAVAHELRTPIAELQSLCEVTLRWPDDRDSAGKSLAEALNIAKEMHVIVNSLMALARCQEGLELPKNEPVNLSAAVNESWLSIQDNKMHSAGHCNIEIDVKLIADIDPQMLAVVLRNLLTNVVAYRAQEGSCRVKAERSGDSIKLGIGNNTTNLQRSDLPHLAEAFWRKDAARTGGSHAGLGLAIVEAYCGVMKVPIEFSLVDEWFEVTLQLLSHTESPAD